MPHIMWHRYHLSPIVILCSNVRFVVKTFLQNLLYLYYHKFVKKDCYIQILQLVVNFINKFRMPPKGKRPYFLCCFQKCNLFLPVALSFFLYKKIIQ